MRYQHASEMKADLTRTKRDTGSRSKGGADIRKAALTFTRFRRSYGKLALLVGVIFAFADRCFSLADQVSYRKRGDRPVQLRRGAAAAEPQWRFQRGLSSLALADEIATTLTYSRTLDVRPSTVTRKYVSADLDPQKVGQELHVATLLTGHFLKQGHHLLVTLEAIETGTDGCCGKPILRVPRKT